MPDTSDFDHQNEPQGAHRGWGDAFAALPQEAPDAGGWQRVQARLPAPVKRARVRWPLSLAAAAALVLAAAIPLRLLHQVESPAAAPVAQVAASPAATQSVAPSPLSTTPAPVSTPVAQHATPRSGARDAPERRPIRTIPPPAETTRVTAVDAPPTTDLELLYAQSAQLEALLALARDERVSTGTSAALSEELDARLAGIDATLIQAGLDDAQRADLWDRRVDALQQLVGVETTNRLYAARGQRFDAALVSVD